MNKYTAMRSCCTDCTDRHANVCYGCIVGIHRCPDPCKECLKEDNDAERGVTA
ncbi:MAG: hypothetical protein WCS17_12370 [Prevotella sp.]